MSQQYNVEENHYKKMLDLQEKLRKSEEERIRLEERFNLLVQESRNRHQACINKLKIRYMEFLEEQRIRNERNSKLLVCLNKVDSSLLLMTAKTERLNVLRKQYESYLLRTYENLRSNGSVTVDSGLESQRDQEFSPVPLFKKSVEMVNKHLTLDKMTRQNYKMINLEENKPQKLNDAQNITKVRQNFNLKNYEPSESPLYYENLNDIFQNPIHRSRFLDNSNKYSNTQFKADIETEKNSLKTFATKPWRTNLSMDCDLDRYIGKIKRLHIKTPEKNESNQRFETSFEEADYEQNTSGDLLNTTLSEDVSSSEEDAKKQRNKFYKTRQALSLDNDSHILTEKQLNDYGSRTQIDSLSVPFYERRYDVYNESEKQTLSMPVTNDFHQSDLTLNTPQSNIKKFANEPLQQSIGNSYSKLQNLDESQEIIEETENLHKVADLSQTEKPKTLNEDKNDDLLDQEIKDNSDGCIEYDYDDTVDIDTWMPDNMEDRVQEDNLHDKTKERPRRKLESIMEVEQAEDDDAHEMENIQQVDLDKANGLNNQLKNQDFDKIEESTNSQNLLKENQDEQPSVKQNSPELKETNEDFNTNEKYAVDQQYYQKDNDLQQQYQESPDYFQTYNQQQENQQHEYHYPDNGANQEYTYDTNAQYSEYENQPYMETSYGDYLNGQYQLYDPNQTYEQDPNQYQQYTSGEEYQNYEQSKEHGQEFNDESSNKNLYEARETYDYLQQQPTFPEEDIPKSSNADKSDNSLLDHVKEQFSDNDQHKQLDEAVPTKNETTEFPKENIATAQDLKSNLRDSKKKKDVIKSILDSDSESFIERNLSNTESDFDFN